MYCSVRRYRTDPARMDELIALITAPTEPPDPPAPNPDLIRMSLDPVDRSSGAERLADPAHLEPRRGYCFSHFDRSGSRRAFTSG